MRNSRILIAVLVLLVPASAFGTPVAIPGLFTTGVDNSGTNLPFGSIDPHWVISAAPSFYGPNAFVENPRPAAWISNTLQSQWIGPFSIGTVDVAGGLYVYDQTFDLTGLDETTAVVQGAWASDDGSRIFLNGAFTGISHTAVGGPFGALDTFTLNSGFVPGINTLSIHVANSNGTGGPFGSNGTPSGLHVARLRGRAELIPEPASALLAVLGLCCSLCWRSSEGLNVLPSTFGTGQPVSGMNNF